MANGRPLHVRPIVPADGDALRAFHARLSDESVYFRYFGVKPELSDDEVRHLTTLDYDRRVAFVGLLRGEIVGVARYEGIDATTAEVAFVVRDDQQGRGVGSILLEHLAAAARERGIGRFVAETLPMNQRMLGTFRESGFEVSAHRNDDVIEVTFGIDATQASRAVQAAREQRAEARSIARLLSPARIAIVGVSRVRESVGHQVLVNLGASGFGGDIVVVHPEADRIAGHPCVPSLDAVDGTVDLVIVSVDASTVLSVVEAAARRQAIGLIVISGGFGDTGAQGRARQDELVARARASGMRVVGPNALGIITTDPAMNASLVPRMPRAGDVAVFAQSGALAMSLLDRMDHAGLGVRAFVSAGNRADVSGNDMLQFWEGDPGVAVVLLYLESIGNGRKFVRLLQRTTPSTPVLMVRTGGSGALLPTGHAAMSTGLSQHAVSQMLESAGLIVLDRVDDMLDAASLLTGRRPPSSRRVAIIGNSDAVAVLACNAAERHGLVIDTVEVFARDSAPERYRSAMAGLDGATSAVLVHVPAIERVQDAAILAELSELAAEPDRCVVRVLPSGVGDREPAVFHDVERAISALAAVARAGEQAAADAAPEDDEPEFDHAGVEAAIEAAVRAGAAQASARTCAGEAALAILAAAGVTLDIVPTAAAPGLAVAIEPDQLFGPVLQVGLDSDLASLLEDTSTRLAPLPTVMRAEEALAGLRGLPLAGAVQDAAPLLHRLSWLVAGPGDIRAIRLRGLQSQAGRAVCTGVELEVGSHPAADPTARRM